MLREPVTRMRNPLFLTILVLLAVLCVYLPSMACSAPVQGVSDGMDSGDGLDGGEFISCPTNRRN